MRNGEREREREREENTTLTELKSSIGQYTESNSCLYSIYILIHWHCFILGYIEYCVLLILAYPTVAAFIHMQ